FGSSLGRQPRRSKNDCDRRRAGTESGAPAQSVSAAGSRPPDRPRLFARLALHPAARRHEAAANLGVDGRELGRDEPVEGDGQLVVELRAKLRQGLAERALELLTVSMLV